MSSLNVSSCRILAEIVSFTSKIIAFVSLYVYSHVCLLVLCLSYVLCVSPWTSDCSNLSALIVKSYIEDHAMANQLSFLCILPNATECVHNYFRSYVQMLIFYLVWIISHVVCSWCCIFMHHTLHCDYPPLHIGTIHSFVKSWAQISLGFYVVVNCRILFLFCYLVVIFVSAILQTLG